MSTKTPTGLSALTLILAASGWMLAQTPPNPSLTPPGAPTDGVFKTLDQVEPRIAVNAVNTPSIAGDGSLYSITSPGSYYLTSNLIANGTQNGIRIWVEGVTLDLNGFVIDGSATTGSAKGVWSVAEDRTTIVNGKIYGWSSSGLQLGDDSVLEDLQVIDNNRDDLANSAGANIGSRGVVRRCSFNNNGFAGFYARFADVNAVYVSDSVAHGNRGAGFFLRDEVMVVGCHAVGNTGSGIDVVSGEVRDCYVDGNGGAGISVVSGRVVDNHCANNATGIFAGGSFGFIVGNQMVSNTTQFDIQTGNVVGKIYEAALTIGAISGSGTVGGVGAGVGTTDPWANFTH